MASATPQAFPYQGSKRALSPFLSRLVPADTSRLVEAFAGSAALSLHLASIGALRSFELNDRYEPIVRLWQAILTDPVALADDYADLFEAQLGRERAFYDEVRQRFHADPTPARLLYLLSRCVKAAVRFNARGQFNQAPDNRRLGARPQIVRRRLLAVQALLGGRTSTRCADYAEVLLSAGPRDLVYLDPPYQGVSGPGERRYADPVCLDRLTQVLAEANESKLCYMVSFDGQTGSVHYGRLLPPALGLTRLELLAGRSSQATLLGRDATTVESLYLAPELVRRLGTAHVERVVAQSDGRARRPKA